MGLKVHTGNRYIISDGCVSEPIPMRGKSILAGCMQSVAWTRFFLHDLLEHVHRAYRPISVQSWVDDLAQRIQGAQEIVHQKTVAATCDIVKGLSKIGCKVSVGKTVMLVSNPKLAKLICASLKSQGIHIKEVASARDLGGDATLAKRRRTGTFNARIIKGRLKAQKLQALIRIDKKS